MTDGEQTSTASVEAPPKLKADIRAEGIKAYYDATTREAKAEAIKKYPFLTEIFSETR